MATIIKLPAPLLPSILSYLTLYRPAKSALSWKKALRITKELAGMVTTGHVLEQGKVARPCPPQIWAMAIEQMIERRSTLSLPLANHNYLRKIAYSIADQEDAKKEMARNQDERTGNHRRPAAVQVDDGLLPIERALREKEARVAGQRKDAR